MTLPIAMSQEILNITPARLALTLVFVLLVGITSLLWKLRLERSLAIGTVRTFAQLMLMGLVLKYIFALDHPLPVMALLCLMLSVAAHTVGGRLTNPPRRSRWDAFLAIACSSAAVGFWVIVVVVHVKPWWQPQYVIPLLGMIMGNAMTSASIAMERLLGGLRDRRAQVELYLSLGGTRWQAAWPVLRDAVYAGMIPSINALMTVGIVALPGMMTGQILAGVEPIVAVKYQIVVMLMLAAGNAISALVGTVMVVRRCFSPAHQLLL